MSSDAPAVKEGPLVGLHSEFKLADLLKQRIRSLDLYHSNRAVGSDSRPHSVREKLVCQLFIQSEFIYFAHARHLSRPPRQGKFVVDFSHNFFPFPLRQCWKTIRAILLEFGRDHSMVVARQRHGWPVSRSPKKFR